MNSQSIRDAKNFYCGYLNSLISEYERVRNLNGKRIKDNIVNLINLFYKDYKEFSEIIKGRLSYYDNNEPEEDAGIKDNNSVISSQLK